MPNLPTCFLPFAELRSQLNNFLLRSLAFVMEKTSHVPPITTPDLQPFGVQVSSAFGVANSLADG